MKRIFECADQYVQESNWKEMAMLKFCLCAAGIMIGLNVPKKAKKPVIWGAAAVFAATCIPLMMKYVKIAAGKFKE